MDHGSHLAPTLASYETLLEVSQSYLLIYMHQMGARQVLDVKNKVAFKSDKSAGVSILLIYFYYHLKKKF